MPNRSSSTLFILRFSFTIFFLALARDEIYIPDDNISTLHPNAVVRGRGFLFLFSYFFFHRPDPHSEKTEIHI